MQEPPTYEEYTSPPSGNSLLEVEDGLTMNQRHTHRSRGVIPPGLECFANRLWIHLTAIWVLLFVTFIIACTAMSRANQNAHASSDGSAPASGASERRDHWADRCSSVGYALYGDDAVEFEGHHYQIVGGDWVKMTWRAAESDSWGRCYGGKPGYLASIGSEAENQFLTEKLTQHAGFRFDDQAWLGATDMVNEGVFAWLDGYAKQTVFWSRGGPVDGVYSNFKPGEPNENGEEDCLAFDGRGMWNDDSCYKQLQYFFVEFDA